MKNFLMIQKILPVVMIFILLILLSGCITSKIISTSELPKHLKPICEVQALDTTYWLYNTRIYADTLIGIVGAYEDKNSPLFTKIYIKSDSLMYINSDTTLIFIPFSGIVYAEIQKISNVTAISFGIGVGVAIMLFILAAMWGGV